ncbi:MAG: hypothetical protein ACE5DM_01740 [Candidatus Nanoarchaeia archaeon]
MTMNAEQTRAELGERVIGILDSSSDSSIDAVVGSVAWTEQENPDYACAEPDSGDQYGDAALSIDLCFPIDQYSRRKITRFLAQEALARGLEEKEFRSITDALPSVHMLSVETVNPYILLDAALMAGFRVRQCGNCMRVQYDKEWFPPENPGILYKDADTAYCSTECIEQDKRRQLANLKLSRREPLPRSMMQYRSILPVAEMR